MDYYEILGVSKNATTDEIKKSYRKLAMKHHPDRNPGNKKSEEEFKKIAEAYATLSDEQKKSSYDFKLEQESFVKNARHTHNKGTSGGFNHSFDSQEDISDFMRNVFGNRNFNEFFDEQIVRKPRIKVYDIHLSFWEAVFGVSKFFEFVDDKGKKRSFNVAFPPAIEDGITLEVGMYSHPPVHFKIHVQSDPYFTRDHLDLYTTIEIPMTKALLGGTMRFPHWDHTYDINIPIGTQNSQTLRLPNAGIKKDMFVGDLYLKCKIIIPKKLTKKQKEIIESFAATEKEDTSFLNSLKETWNKFVKKKEDKNSQQEKEEHRDN